MWLTSSHEASHDPEALVLVARNRIHRLSLVLARAAGWAEVLAPHAEFHMSMAGCVLRASGGPGGRDHVLPAALVDAVAYAAESTAVVLAETIADDDVVGGLMDAADELCELLTEPLPSRHSRRLAAPLAPTVRLRVPERTLGSLSLAVETLETPLLLPSPPESTSEDHVGIRAVAAMTAELSALPSELAEVERRLRSALQLIARSLFPLPAISDATLDVVALSVIDLHLAALRAHHLNDMLAATPTPEVATWAQRAAARITDRLQLVTDAVTLVLEELECLA